MGLSKVTEVQRQTVRVADRQDMSPFFIPNLFDTESNTFFDTKRDLTDKRLEALLSINCEEEMAE